MKNLMSTFLQVWIILGLLSTTSNANPVGISISGKIIEDSTGLALTGPVAFRVKLMSKDNCILYSEEFTTSLSSTGTFTFTLGKGANSVNAYYPTNPVTGQSVVGMNRLFSNLSPVAVTSLGNGAATGSTISSDNVACPGTYTPAADDFRKVRIEFDNGDSQGYRAILPYHQIRTVPYAMIAEEAGDSEKLGGVAAADFAKLSDLPDLATGVPAAETDPSVQAFAKSAVTGVSGNSCPAGYILTLDNNVLKCIVDGGSGGGAYTLPVATDSVLGGVMVPGSSDIAVDGSGNLTLKALATSKITGLDTALSNLGGGIKYTDMPGTSCGAGEALVWTSPANTFSCYSLSIAQSQVTNLTTDLAGKVSKAGDTMSGALNMGSQDVLATGHITMSNQKTITVGKYNQTQEDSLAGTLTGSNEGATWYNSAMKALRFWDGSARQTVVATTAACTDGQLLKWNDTTKVWYCAADAGASGGANATQIQSTDVAVTAPTTTGQVLRYNSVTSKWEPSMLQAADIPSGLARSKVTAGSVNHVLINDGSGLMSSEAQLAVSRGGTGQSTYTDGQLLIGKTDGTLAKANITAGSGVTVTNGDGTITIAATATSNITDGTIVDADVNAAAAIARSKLANGTANRMVVNNASGVISDAAAITASRALVSDANGIPTHSVTTSAELAFVNGVTSSIQNQLDALTTSSSAKVAKAGDAMTGNLVMNAQNEVRFADADSSNYIAFKSPTTVASNVTYTLPAADGSVNQVLQTNGSGTLSWATAASGADNLGNHTATANITLGSHWLSGDGNNEGIYVDGSGKVGINNSAPASTLQVQGSVGVLSGADPFFAVSAANIKAPVSTGHSIIPVYSFWYQGNTGISNPAANEVGITIDGTEKVRVTATGKVGIGGVSNPAEALSVAGKIQSTTGGFVFPDGTTQITAAAGGTDTLGGLSCSSGDVASWNGSAWVCQGAGNANVASTIVKRSPSGAIAAGIADFTGVRVFDGVSGYITLQTPATVTSYSLTLPTGTGTNGQMLTTNGSGVLSWSSPSASLPGLAAAKMWVGNVGGTATAVSMSGDATIDDTGILTIGASKIGSNHILDSSIDNVDINPSANIDRSKIASGVAYGLVVNNSSGVMQNGLACATVGHVPTWTATGFTCQAPSMSVAALTSGNIWVGNGSNVAASVTMSGDVTIDNAGATSIGTGKVTSSHIANGTIADTDISSSAAISRSKIASGTNYAIVTNNSSGVMGAGLACSTVGHVPTWTATGFTCQAQSASLPTLASANIWVGNGSSAATAVPASGDVTLSNAGAFAVTKIQGRSVSSTAPTAGQVLMYLSSTWTPTSPTTTGAVSSLLSLDSSGIATALGVDIKGATTGTVGLRAPNSFTSYNLTMPADDGDANQVLTTNGSGTLTWTSPGGAPTITAKTADFTVATGEDNYFYMITNTTTASLPPVASVPAGFRATFKRMGGANVNILANGTETIDGATQRSLTSVYQTISVMNTGAEWAVIGGGATGTLAGCVPGSQSFPGAGTYSLVVDADRASKCKFTITVQGAGGGTGSSGGTGGRGGALSAVYTAPGAGTFEIYVGSPGLSGGNGGSGGGGAGGNGSSGKGGGGGGASAVRWTTTAPTDILLAIAGGGGGGASTGLNGGGNGGGVIAATNGQTTAATEGGKAGVNNVGGAGGTGSGNGGGAGGSSSGAGSSGVGGSPVAAGGAAVSAFSISGGGGGGVATLQACGGGGGGYGGGGGGAVGSSIYGGGGGGGGYVNSSALDSFTSVTGPAAGVSGSVLIEWN